jgi:hypothetical protein
MNLMNKGSAFVKLMVVGRVNNKVKQMLSKDDMNEVDSKVLKGLFSKSIFEKAPMKSITETFNLSNCE